jgi:hypothetical protein
LASPFPPQIQIGDQADPAAGGSQDPEQQIKDALDQIRQALSADGFTDQEKLTLEKVTTLLQGLSATRASEQQAALGGGPATNYIRRATGA